MHNVAIKYSQVFADASGAEALVVCDGFTFSFNILGAVVCNLVTVGGRSPSKRVVALANWRYSEFLKTLTPEWLAANKDMYPTEAHYVG